jgi:hypothetical protein
MIPVVQGLIRRAFSALHQKCSANFWRKPLIFLERVFDSAQVGLVFHDALADDEQAFTSMPPGNAYAPRGIS